MLPIAVHYEIKRLLWHGNTVREITQALSVSESIVYKIRRGDLARDVPWPDDTYGPLPATRIKHLQDLRGKEMIRNRRPVPYEPRDYVSPNVESKVQMLQDQRDQEWDKVYKAYSNGEMSDEDYKAACKRIFGS